jgi:hypothetical protein
LVVPFVFGEQRRAEHAGPHAVARQANSRTLAQPGQDVAAGDSLGGFQQQLAGPRSAAADHHLLGIEGVDRVGNPDPETLAPDFDHPRRRGIAVLGGVDGVATAHGLAIGLEPAQRRVRMQVGRLRGETVESMSRRHELE